MTQHLDVWIRVSVVPLFSRSPFDLTEIHRTVGQEPVDRSETELAKREAELMRRERLVAAKDRVG